MREKESGQELNMLRLTNVTQGKRKKHESNSYDANIYIYDSGSFILCKLFLGLGDQSMCDKVGMRKVLQRDK